MLTSPTSGYPVTSIEIFDSRRANLGKPQTQIACTLYGIWDKGSHRKKIHYPSLPPLSLNGHMYKEKCKVPHAYKLQILVFFFILSKHFSIRRKPWGKNYAVISLLFPLKRTYKFHTFKISRENMPKSKLKEQKIFS